MSANKPKKEPLSVTHPDLIKEWDYDKNAPLLPSEVTSGNNKKVWWKCSLGHEWPATINSRAIHKRGCPFCSGRRAITGENDLATLRPDLAEEWNSEKNGNLKPSEVMLGSGEKVCWKCSLGHEWPAIIYSRAINGSNCPFCSGRNVITGENDLATLRPDLAKEWNSEKNSNLKPTEVMLGSSKKVWWKCQLGHEWPAVISSRVKGSGCPYCSGHKALAGYNDLSTVNPDIAKEWHPTKNGNLTPDMVTANSDKKVWWRCSQGHEWISKVDNRSRGHGCHVCARLQRSEKFLNSVILRNGSLAETHPDLAKEWDYEKNGELKPEDVSFGTSKKVWWKCSRGHEWPAYIYSRSNGYGCPFCKKAGTSMPEQGVAFYLSQVTDVQSRVKLFGKEVDVYLPNYSIGIEYDGVFYHKNRGEKDSKKEKYLINKGVDLYKLIESDKNCHIENKFYFVVNSTYTNYEHALRELFTLFAVKTQNSKFADIDINFVRDRLKIRERIDLYEKENSLSEKYPEIAKEWNYDKNGILTPDMFIANSNEKVWWKCSKGHEWPATISNRARNAYGCPYCSGRLAIAGETDLLTTCPNLAKEWNYDRNGDLKPSSVTMRSMKKVWWKCSKGHEWPATIDNRSRGKGCPYCSGRAAVLGQTDLASNYPELAKEWDYEKNEGRKPSEYTVRSNEKVWWKCEKGHEWPAVISSRTSGTGCPYCSGHKLLSGFNDLSTRNPKLVDEWNYEKNGDLKPENIYEKSTKKVWWKCSKGHEWPASIVSRSKGHGCPYCANNAIKAVMCIETGKTYPSSSAANKEIGVSGVGDCCRGTQNTAGGYHWKYIDYPNGVNTNERNNTKSATRYI